MRLRVFLGNWLGVCTLAAAAPVSAAAEDFGAVMKAARTALGQGIFQVSAVKAERLLSDPKITAPQRQAAAALAVESWVRAGDGRKALALVQGNAFPEKDYWHAHALALTGELDAARALLESHPEDGPLGAQARLLLAYMHMAEGKEVAARRELKDLRELPDEAIARHARLMFNEMEITPERAQTVLDRLAREGGGKSGEVQFLRAKASLELGDAPKAEALLRDILALPGIGERAHDAAIILLAHALLRQNDPQEARAELVRFIQAAQNRDTAFWGEAFDLLQRAHSLCPDHDTVYAPVVEWMSGGLSRECRGHAMCLVARWLANEGRQQEAVGVLEAFLHSMPGHTREGEAMRELMEIHGRLRADERVLALASVWRERYAGGAESLVDSITGEIFFERGDLKKALAEFQHAAGLAAGLGEKRRAIFNAAVVALQAGEAALYQTLLAQVAAIGDTQTGSKAPPGAPGDSAADLRLERALQLAAQRDAGAEVALQEFLTEHPGHPRALEGQIAIAELCLLDLPPRLKPAEAALEKAAAVPDAPQPLRERIAYVRMWLREAAGDLAASASEGETFLNSWPGSAFADEVRMKVADCYFRLEDYPNARTHFETLATEQPDSPYAEAALFFAAKAAIAVISPEGRERALEIWQELAEREGAFSILARVEHLHALRRDERAAEALVLLEGLLEEKNLEPDMRRQLVCEKIELLLLLGPADAKRYETAAAVAREFLATAGLPYLWTARAGWLLSQACRGLGRPAEALEACYDVVDTTSAGPENPAEFRWFYMAGFDAIALLEQDKQWEAAAKLAEQLSKTAGDQAADARKRATDIRLKHFLWDNP